MAYPTEAIFGLGCNPDSEIAVNKLLDLKKRSWKKGLILIAANYKQLLPYIDDEKLLGKTAKDILSSRHNPVTWIMPAKIITPQWLTGQFSTIAVRVSQHPLVHTLCSHFGKPIVSTSANISGLKPCRTSYEVYLQFGKNVPIIHELVGTSLNPSEIRDALTGKLFRQG